MAKLLKMILNENNAKAMKFTKMMLLFKEVEQHFIGFDN